MLSKKPLNIEIIIWQQIVEGSKCNKHLFFPILPQKY